MATLQSLNTGCGCLFAYLCPRAAQALAIATTGGQLLCHSAADGAALAALPGHDGGARAVLWGAPGLVSAGADGFVRLWA